MPYKDKADRNRRARERRAANPEHYRAIEKARRDKRMADTVARAAELKKMAERSKEHYERNKAKRLEQIKEYRSRPEVAAKMAAYYAKYRKEHREEANAATAAWRKRNPDRCLAATMKWRKKNIDRYTANKCRWDRENRKKNPFAAIMHSCRVRLNFVLAGRTKPATTAELVGCTREELLAHIERQFQPGMTWENRGRTGWHVDHIRPVSSFDPDDPDAIRAATHYTNLQPLWYSQNLRKGNKWSGNPTGRKRKAA